MKKTQDGKNPRWKKPKMEKTQDGIKKLKGFPIINNIIILQIKNGIS